MRTLIDLAPRQVEQLARLALARRRSRAALVREAVDEYLARRPPPADDGFGAWGPGEDGIELQRRLRAEW